MSDLCVLGCLSAGVAAVGVLIAWALAAPHESERGDCRNDDPVERLFAGLHEPTRDDGWEW